MATNDKPTREPIWKRLGFATQNQYRNAQVAKLTNPKTGKPFTSYRQYRDYRAAELGRPRDTAAERERADIRARRQGFESARARQEANRRRRMALSVSKSDAFKKWGITESQFNRMRTANKKYDGTGAQYTAANTYDLAIDRDIRNYSDERVGYIVSFYHAVVDRKTNYWSLFDKKTKRRRIKFGYPETNEWQRMYLVEYGGLMSPTNFETRYGSFLSK